MWVIFACLFTLLQFFIILYNSVLKKKYEGFRLLCTGDSSLSLIGCRSNTVLDIAGLTAYEPHGRRSEMRGCPYTTALGLQLEAMCDGQPRCFISNHLLQLTKDQCPGVSSVFVDVDCKPPGTTHFEPLFVARSYRGTQRPPFPQTE